MAVAVVLLPLLGSLIAGVLAVATPANAEARHAFDRLAQYATCAAMILAALLSSTMMWFLEYFQSGLSPFLNGP